MPQTECAVNLVVFSGTLSFTWLDDLALFALRCTNAAPGEFDGRGAGYGQAIRESLASAQRNLRYALDAAHGRN